MAGALAHSQEFVADLGLWTQLAAMCSLASLANERPCEPELCASSLEMKTILQSWLGEYDVRQTFLLLRHSSSEAVDGFLRLNDVIKPHLKKIIIVVNVYVDSYSNIQNIVQLYSLHIFNALGHCCEKLELLYLRNYRGNCSIGARTPGRLHATKRSINLIAERTVL